jgi:hypothetical protein
MTPPPREHTALSIAAVIEIVRNRNRYESKKIWSSGAGKIRSITVARYEYRVVMRMKRENVTIVSAFIKSEMAIRTPLSVKIAVSPNILSEISGNPGSPHTRIPISEKTNKIGSVYHNINFFAGNPAIK